MEWKSTVDWFKVWNPSFLLNLIKILSPFAFAKDASAAFCSMIDPIREPTESLMVPWCNNNSSSNNNNNNVAATKAPLGAGTRSRRSQGDAFLGCRFISIHCNILIILSTAPACTPNHADHDLIVTSRRLQIWCQEVWGWQQLHQRTRDSFSFRLWFCLRQVLWQSVKGFTEKSKSILARQVVIRCCSMLFAVPPPWLAIEAKYLMYRNDSKCDNRYPGFRSNIQPYTAWHFNTFHSERSSAPAFPCRTFAPPPHTSAMPRWTFSPDWLRVDLSRAGNVRVCWEPQADLAFKCFQQLSLFISAWNTSIVVKFEASAPCNSKHFLKSCEILGFVSQIVASQRTSVAPSALMT